MYKIIIMFISYAFRIKSYVYKRIWYNT
jgi:hypothetical protein